MRKSTISGYDNLRLWSSKLPLGIVAALGLLVLVIALWLPYGFNISAQSDEWVHFAFLQIVPFSLRADIRPLLRLPWAVAQLLTPDSFMGLNILLALSFYIKGLALYGIIRRILPGNAALAYSAGALLIVYPGDFAVYNLTVTGIHISVACWLAALYCLVVYWQKTWLLPAVGMLALLFVSLGIVEIGYPLVMFSPLILIFIEKGVNRRMLIPTALWYTAPIFIIGLSVVQSLSGSDVLGYQSTRFAGDNSIPTLAVAALQPFRWLFWDIWGQVAISTPIRLVDTRTWAAFGAAAVSTSVLALHYDTTTDTGPKRQYGLVAVSAAGVMVLGFAVFLPSILRDQQERTLLFAQVGAAIILALAALFLIRLPRLARVIGGAAVAAAAVVIYIERGGANRFIPVLLLVIAAGLILNVRLRYALVISGCIGLFTGYAYTQHEVHIQRGRVQQPYLSALAKAAPSIQSDTLILILNEADDPTLYTAFWRRNDVFGSAVQFIYDDPTLRAYLCWNDLKTPAPDLGTCMISDTQAGVVYDPRYQPTYITTSDKLVVMSWTADGTMQVLVEMPEAYRTAENANAYDPLQRIVLQSPLPSRLVTVFGIQPMQ